MSENWKHIIEQGECPEIEKLMLYQQNKLDKDERFIIENHLAGCDMCNDVLEGHSNLSSPTSLDEAEKEIKIGVHNFLYKEKTRKLIPFNWKKLSVAASLLILVGIGFMFFFIPRFGSQKIAQRTEEPNSVPKMEHSDALMSEPDRLTNTKADKKETTSKEFSKNIKYKEKRKEAKERLPATPITTMDAPSPSKLNDIAEEVPHEAEASSSVAIAEEKKAMSAPASKEANLPEEKGIVKGKVVDRTGQGLIGVNVKVKGTGKGTVTDLKGEFKINVEKDKQDLDFSYIGYVGKDISVRGDTTLTVELNENVQALDEVVVIGYGVQKKSELSGAISSVPEKSLSRAKSKKTEVSPNQTQIESTISALNERLLKDKSDKEALIGLTRSYVQLNDTAKAMQSLGTLISINKDEKTINQLNSIKELIRRGNNKKALKALDNLKGF